MDMAERHFYMASMDYVVQIQEVHERKKFEFVETLLSFMFSWFTFYHQVKNYKKKMLFVLFPSFKISFVKIKSIPLPLFNT